MTRTTRSGAADGDEYQTPLDRAKPLLVSLHFMRTALRRRLLVCVLAPIVGLLAAAGFMVAFPPAHAAKASLVLTYDSQQEATSAMETNLSLLKTETLANRTISDLGLSMSSADFLGTVTVEQVGSQLLSLTVTAPDDAEAVRRLTALTTVYLGFRAEQLSYQSQVVVDGLQAQIDKLKDQVAATDTQVTKLNAAKTPNPDKIQTAIALRTSTQSRIDTLGQSLEDAVLRNSAVVQSSRVLDPPAAEPGRAKRSLALGLASGLIGGTALGWGGVLFLAITSNRLRRRADVASVLNVDVKVSVGRITPLRRVWARLPPVRALDRRRTYQRSLLARAISEELLRGPTRQSSLAVACINNASELGYAVTDAARNLAERGHSVTIIDLTDRGSRGLRSASDNGSALEPTVLRSRGFPALAHSVSDLLAVGQWDAGEDTPTPELTNVTLVVAELDPGIGAEHLASWTERAMLVVTAGRSSVEKTRTIADQIRAAGLDLRFAALMRSERSDHSGGSVRRELPAPAEISDEQPELELQTESRGRLGAR